MQIPVLNQCCGMINVQDSFTASGRWGEYLKWKALANGLEIEGTVDGV